MRRSYFLRCPICPITLATMHRLSPVGSKILMAIGAMYLYSNFVLVPFDSVLVTLNYWLQDNSITYVPNCSVAYLCYYITCLLVHHNPLLILCFWESLK
uniref:Uncharacterized protein n=1 Tax=Myoviridae sp. ct2cn10 TaxID=2825022 RepID=A0A8S5PBY0_9CAUD|nr:MAG TPA: hypothetical protein [Myoviridae sp. ct2cn10]